MLRREKDKIAFQGFEPAANRERLIKMAGLAHLDEATLLGALLETRSMLAKEGVMEQVHNKGREALRVLLSREKARPVPAAGGEG